MSIECIPILDVVLATATTISLVAQVLYLRHLRSSFKASLSDGSLRSRLEAYSILKVSETPKRVAKPESEMLEQGAHDVLLGTLKKIETKSAVLTTIIVFALGIMINAAYSDGDSYDGYGLLAVALAAHLVFPLYFSFVGIRQLDQRHFEPLRSQDEEKVAVLLQRALMGDLLQKERAFRFSWIVSSAALICFVVIIVVDAVFSVSGTGFL